MAIRVNALTLRILLSLTLCRFAVVGAADFDKSYSDNNSTINDSFVSTEDHPHTASSNNSEWLVGGVSNTFHTIPRLLPFPPLLPIFANIIRDDEDFSLLSQPMSHPFPFRPRGNSSISEKSN